MTSFLSELNLNWTLIITGSISALITGFATATGIVIANRYTVRFLDRIEKRKGDDHAK